MEELQQRCTNCKRDVPISNMTIHVVHCMRNIVVCPTCKDTIQKDNYADHLKQHTRLINCSDCRKQFTQMMLDDHRQHCDQRMTQCEYCELDLRQVDMPDHMLFCGARTERCPDCNELVMFKYQKLHLESNHTFLKLDDEPGPSASWQQNNSPPTKSSELNNHTRRNIKSVENAFSQFDFPYLPVSSAKPLDKINSFRKKETESEYFEKGKGAITKVPNTVPYSSRTLNSNDIDYGIKPVPRPHRQVDRYSGLSELRNVLPVHIPASLNTREDSTRANANPPSNLGAIQRPKHTHRQKRIAPQPPNSPNRRPKSLNLAKHINRSTNDNSISWENDDPEDVKLPCEHCNTMIPASKLVLHEAMCRYDRDIEQRVIIPVAKNNDSPKGANDRLTGKCTSFQEAELPCEFCFSLYPASRLLEHQQLCEVNY